MLLALLFAHVFGTVLLKNLFERTRPYLEHPHLETILQSGGYSFPSGHTSSSFAALTVLLLTFKKYKIWFILLACAIAFSRMYFFVHYPSDILGGIVVGVAMGFLAVKIIYIIKEKYFNKVKQKNNKY
jgi:undecaprenyl-diphosphatase